MKGRGGEGGGERETRRDKERISRYQRVRTGKFRISRQLQRKRRRDGTRACVHAFSHFFLEGGCVVLAWFARGGGIIALASFFIILLLL
jgi:hypothetical protein